MANIPCRNSQLNFAFKQIVHIFGNHKNRFMSYVQSIYHLVFTTYHRRPTIDLKYTADLYKVLGAQIMKLHCNPILINGVEDHVHVLFELNQSVALADFVRKLKSTSSLWMKQSGLFPLFEGWEREYGAFSVSYTHLNPVREYVANQREHHKNNSLTDEYDRLILKAGLVKYVPPCKWHE